MRNRDTKMVTTWVATGQGSLLADLIDAAYTVERVSLMTPLLGPDGLKALLAHRKTLEDRGRGAEVVNLKTERGALLIGHPRGLPSTDDAHRIATALFIATSAHWPR